MAPFAPMPRASETTAIRVTKGVFQRVRKASLRLSMAGSSRLKSFGRAAGRTLCLRERSDEGYGHPTNRTLAPYRRSVAARARRVLAANCHYVTVYRTCRRSPRLPSGGRNEASLPGIRPLSGLGTAVRASMPCSMRAVASHEVWRIHRRLYCLSDRYMQGRINPLELAQCIHGPSYVSLESALSYHSWIPEGVQAVTSVAMGRSRTFDTPVGLFSFTCVPQRRRIPS